MNFADKLKCVCQRGFCTRDKTLRLSTVHPLWLIALSGLIEGAKTMWPPMKMLAAKTGPGQKIREIVREET
jgi:hypothetical protein